MSNKYKAVRTWSNSWGVWFASGAEATRGEELLLLQRAGEICELERQPQFTLWEKPKITITLDFAYFEEGKRVYEDVKGVLTRDFRTKLAWLQEKYGIEVKLIK